ncbi:MAG: nucleoside triphosphate hydrolase, partial [Deinococcus sp.]|nr:nucleoside triphosphate hydrolase [Deinococcus sp.]
SNWQAIKTAERGGKPRSAADRVPAALGALARETQAQKLAGRSKPADAAGRLEAMSALQAAAPTEAGVAEALAAVVAWARGLGIDPEVALRAQTQAVLAALPDPA